MKYLIALLFPLLMTGQNQFTKDEITISEFVKGTMYKPVKPNGKLMIVIAGSGPTNRDGNQPGARSNAYKMLAEGVVASGTSVFCFDKRIIGQMIAVTLTKAHLPLKTRSLTCGTSSTNLQRIIQK